MPEVLDHERFYRFLIESLEGAGIPYMVVGGYAAATHGPPRSTLDLDVIVDAGEPEILALARALGDRADFDIESAFRAAREKDECNVLDASVGAKADLWWLKAEDYDRERFARRKKIRFPWGMEHWITTPEDLVLQKLRWRAKGGTQRHMRDAAAVLEVSGPSIDTAYLEKWAGRLGLLELLAEARRGTATK